MSALNMPSVEKPQTNTQGKTPESGAALRAPDKKRRKELVERAMRARSAPIVPSGVRPEPEAAGKETKLEAVKKEDLIDLLRNAHTLKEAKEIFDAFGSGVMTPEEFHAIMREWQEERRQLVATSMESESAVETEAVRKESVEEPEAVMQAGAAVTEEAAEVGEIVEEQPQAPVSVQPSAHRFDKYEDLEEAFGRGDIGIDEFLREKKRFPKGASSTTETTAPVEVNQEVVAQDESFYQIVKDYVEAREKQRRIKIEEEKLRARKRARKAKSRRQTPEEGTERSDRTQEPEFAPTEEMQRIIREIKSTVDTALDHWRRLTAYEKLDTKAFEMVEELAEDFRRIERLKNRFIEEEIKARRIAETEREKSKGAARGPATRPVEQLGSVKPVTIGELLEFKKKQREEEELRKRERVELNRRKKQLVATLRHRPEKGFWTEKEKVLSEYLERWEEAFGAGEMEPEEFRRKKDLIKNLRAIDNISEALEIAFGDGTLSIDEYKDLKKRLINGTSPR